MLVDKFWAEALSDVLRKGEERIDRTGVGTLSRFGIISGSTSVNYGNQIPIITLKKVHFKSVLAELIWFIKGKTNVDFLHKYNCTIWNGWHRPWFQERDIVSVRKIIMPYTPLSEGFSNSYRKGKYKIDSNEEKLATTWKNMIDRCYNPSNKKYRFYGKVGVSVNKRWHIVDNFIEDATKLPHWIYKKNDWSNFELDKDYYGAKQYGPDTCIWLHKKENVPHKWIKITEPSGNFHIIDGMTNASDLIGVSRSSIHRFITEGFPSMLKGNNKKVKNWKFEYVNEDNSPSFYRRTLIDEGDLGPIYGCQWRDFNGIDQLTNVIESIKNDPFGRRHIVSAWNPNDIDKMALPPCHLLFQFYVSKHGYLDILFYMRSCDLFLGFPFNVTSYALLLMIVAKLTGYTAGNVHWHLGDAHIYKNHIDQVKIALGRTMVSPQNAQIVFADKVYNSIDDFEVEDIELINYQSHPAIKAPIAI